LLKKHPRAYKVEFVMDATLTDRGQLSVFYKKQPQEEFSPEEKSSLYGIWVPDAIGPAPAAPTPPTEAPAAVPSSTAAKAIGNGTTDLKKPAPFVIRYCDTSPTF
jgi:hypothetical protein